MCEPKLGCVVGGGAYRVEPKRPDRWDGWDDPDYTQAELEEPIALEDAETAAPEDGRLRRDGLR